MRGWWSLHKWSSLICTVFLLLMCITGLPLIFHEEIDALTAPATSASAAPKLPVDRLVAQARQNQPDLTPQIAFLDPAEPELWQFLMSPTAASPLAEGKIVAVHARTGKVIGTEEQDAGIMAFITRLHVDLFMGLPGKLFLGLMGMCFLVALVSGIIVYALARRSFAFGTVRGKVGKRVWWRDTHGLVGAVTLGWAVVVGSTGVINTWADLAIKLWTYTELAEMTRGHQGGRLPTRLASVDAAIATARERLPDSEPFFVAWPGTELSDAHHYGVFMRGTTPFTARLFRPVLIEAGTGAFTATREMPFYITVLLVSQPLHFGDYGGLPLKIVWGLLDLMTIFVLSGGLWIWLKRKLPVAEQFAADLAEPSA